MDAAFNSSLDMKLPPTLATSTVRSFEDAAAKTGEELSLDSIDNCVRSTEVGTVSKEEEDSFLCLRLERLSGESGNTNAEGPCEDARESFVAPR